MKKIKYFLVMSLFLLIAQKSFAQREYICYYMLNSEISRSMEEHEKQKEMRSNQLQTLSLETYNKEEWTKYKTVTEKIKSRLNSASFAIQAIPSSALIAGEIQQIYKLQSMIYKELEDAPTSVALILKNQIDFVDKLQMNIRLMAGIIISYGSINAMEKAERKILLDFATSEFKDLRLQSWSTLSKIRIAKRKTKQRNSMLANWVNKDKAMIQKIMKNAKLY